jgi:trans-aconitate methyltransferase
MTTKEEMAEIRKRVLSSARGAAMLHLAYVGVTGGLFVALRALDRGTPQAIAKEAGRDPGYVARWCDAAYAFELLREAEDGVFELTSLGEAFLPDVPGTVMPMAVGAVLGAHMAERASGLMTSGERPGESVLAERETILPWFGPMLEMQFGPFFEAQIAGSLDAFAEIDARGGTVVDLGCGNGWYLRRLAGRYPKIRGVGLDGFEANINAAKERAEGEGFADRLSFEIGDLHHFSVDEPVDAIAMNRALHHVWNEKGNVFRILREHLVPGGSAIIWEPAWPEDRAALRADAMRPMAFQNLAEHVQGNHFLRPAEIAKELEASGFDASIQLFAEGREAVVVGVKRS